MPRVRVSYQQFLGSEGPRTVKQLEMIVFVEKTVRNLEHVDIQCIQWIESCSNEYIWGDKASTRGLLIKDKFSYVDIYITNIGMVISFSNF
jgi:hypothetical protein